MKMNYRRSNKEETQNKLWNWFKQSRKENHKEIADLRTTSKDQTKKRFQKLNFGLNLKQIVLTCSDSM